MKPSLLPQSLRLTAAFHAWNATPVADRAAALERAGDLIEQDRGRLIALLQIEGGKTIDDCVSEVREAADYCRYYASEARRTLAARALPGPTGESNELRMHGRGVFVCISPWNFPLAIFIGQIAGALAAGNCRCGQARRADAAYRIRGGETTALRRRAGGVAATGAGRRQDRCNARRGSSRRWCCIHWLDRSGAHDQSHASRQKWADRAADR